MRYINIAVNGLFTEKSSKNAGVQGEGNSSALVITFDDSWEDYSKRIIWRDAHGENPVSILFAESYLQSNGSYIIPIPSEPLALPGWCGFTIEGYAAATPTQIAMTVTEAMQVLPAENYYAPAEPTPSQAMQLQEQIDNIELTPGPAGATGPRGAAGPSLVVKGYYESISAFTAAALTGSPGDAYVVNNGEGNVLFVWDTGAEEWVNTGTLYIYGRAIQSVSVYEDSGAYYAYSDYFNYNDGELVILIPSVALASADGETPIAISMNDGTPIPVIGPGGRILSFEAGKPIVLVHRYDGESSYFHFGFPFYDTVPKVIKEDHAPGEDDDVLDAVMVGDVWVNESDNTVYICADNSSGAAVWVQASGSGGDTEAPITGYSTFNGYSTGRVISHTIGSTDYDVRVTPTADPSGQLGEVWVIKGETSCTVKNSGSAVTAFDYVITPWPTVTPS